MYLIHHAPNFNISTFFRFEIVISEPMRGRLSPRQALVHMLLCGTGMRNHNGNTHRMNIIDRVARALDSETNSLRASVPRLPKEHSLHGGILGAPSAHALSFGVFSDPISDGKPSAIDLVFLRISTARSEYANQLRCMGANPGNPGVQ